MKNIIATFTIIFLLALSSCGKDNELSEEDALCGKYQLKAVSWSGNALDLNNDGIGHWDLINEFNQLPGYAPLAYTTIVSNGNEEINNDDSKLTVLASLPLPLYQKVGDNYKIKYLISLPFTLHIKDLKHTYEYPVFPKDKPNSTTFDNLSDIYEVRVVEIDKDTIKIDIRCTLLQKSSTGKSYPQTGYLYYTFSRK